MRYEVPQFIEVEQKVIGPFTWRQFVYLAGGAGALVITFLLLPFIFFLFTGVPVAILAVLLAFHKVNNRPFELFVEAAFNFFTRNKFYLWRIKESTQTIVTGAPQISPAPAGGQEGQGNSKKEYREGGLEKLQQELAAKTEEEVAV